MRLCDSIHRVDHDGVENRKKGVYVEGPITFRFHFFKRWLRYLIHSYLFTLEVHNKMPRCILSSIVDKMSLLVPPFCCL